MAQTLVFLPWQRSGIYELASAPAGTVARLSASVRVELSERDGTDTRSADLPFTIMGPGDVDGLNHAAVRRMVPPPSTLDAETTKYVQVEFASHDIPWRHTPQLKGGTGDMVLRPWILLIVGTPDEIELLSDNQVRLTPEILQDHPLNKSARFTHVQIELREPVEDPSSLTEGEVRALIESGGGRPIARLLSWRPMVPHQEYVAAIVPTFGTDGSYSWTDSESTSVVVPNYFSWRFRTGKKGDFRTLAARLRAVTAPGDLGRAPLTYDRIEPAADLEVRGALAPVGGSDAAIADEVRDDTAALTTPLKDPRGRPVVTPPLYGAAWRLDPAVNAQWGSEVNEDPRHRGVAGLGGDAGITLQDTIVDAVNEQVGAVFTAKQRINQLVFGLQSAGSLWNRRLPSDPMRRVQLFGPTLRRIATQKGATIDQIAGEERALPRALFSSAARRALRGGPARSRQSNPGAADPATVLPIANRCPLPPDKVAPGLSSATDFANQSGNPDLADADTDLKPNDTLLDTLADKVNDVNDPEIKNALTKAVENLRRRQAFARSLLCCLIAMLFRFVAWIKNLIGLDLCILRRLLPSLCQYLQALHTRCEESKGLPYVLLIQILFLLEDPENNKEEILSLIEQLDEASNDSESVSELGTAVQTEPDPLPCSPIDLGILEESLSSAIDPTAPNAWMKARVLSTVEGLEGPELAPVEVCTSVDLPAWRFLRDNKPDWLLPGIGQLKEDSVYAFESNPTFVDAFMLGINTQTLGELRWRNLPIISSCTPLRMFWGRIDPGAGTRVDDIRGVHAWSDGTPLGDDAHSQAGGGTHLVLVFRSELFRRYPDTIVSAIEAAVDAEGNPDFSEEAEPTGEEPRIWPVFQGNVSQDVTFFGFPLTPVEGRRCWLVIEEPPPGYRFRSDLATPIPADGGNFASSRFNDPTRVLIKGGELIPGS